MTLKQRLFWSILLMLRMGSGRSNAEFIRKHHLYGSIGENCMIMKRKLPLYSNLVHLHNNVWVAANVSFITHDVIHDMLNKNSDLGYVFVEKVGCIEVMDNVFIGSGTRILYNTRIGKNVIIGSDSLVTKDIPDNSVFAGVPAKFICTFEEYVQKHKMYSEEFRKKFRRSGVSGMDDSLAAELFEDFKEKRRTVD